jgi:hypothetical protein
MARAVPADLGRDASRAAVDGDAAPLCARGLIHAGGALRWLLPATSSTTAADNARIAAREKVASFVEEETPVATISSSK